MIRRPPRSTLFPLHDALPIFCWLPPESAEIGVRGDGVLMPSRSICSRATASARCSEDRKSTRLNSSHANISYAVFCLKKKKKNETLQIYRQFTCVLRQTRHTI